MALCKWLLLGFLCLLALAAIQPAAAENATLCWGDGSYGQLGDGKGDFQQTASHNSSVPVEVLGGHSFAVVCTGGGNSCGLKPSGQAWCWGTNTIGELGDGTTTNSTTPVEVAGGHTFRSITCGGSHNCALDDGGKAWCWGDNSWGQLATGGQAFSTVPVEAAAGRAFEALSAGTAYTCGIDSGQAFCWGDNGVGQLGDGTTTSSTTPVEVLGGHTFRSITCGTWHTCALDSGGKAWCWGWSLDGQLGNGAVTDDNVPLPVTVSGNRTFTVIAAGTYHTCAIAETGSMWCWGESPHNGQSNDSNVPAEVVGGHTFMSASAGSSTCGLDNSGDVWCFGINFDGQLGDGSFVDSYTPVKVAGDHTFLSLGQHNEFENHMCAIATRQASPGNETETPPSPSPSPSPPQSTSRDPSWWNNTASTSATSSSFPIGAVAGGVGAAVAVAAVLAFFALRPGKGWLRRKPQPGTLEDGSSNSKESPVPCGVDDCSASVAQHSQQDGSSPPEISGALPTSVPAAPGMLPAAPVAAAVAGSSTALDTLLPSSSSQGDQATSLDTFLPSSRATGDSTAASIDTLLPLSRSAGAPPVNSALQAPTAPAEAPPSQIPKQPAASEAPIGSHQHAPVPQPLPPSYLSSVGTGWAGGSAQQPAAVVPAAVLAAGVNSSPSSSIHAPGSDPMLSFISSYLDSHPRSAAQHSSAPSQPEAALAPSGNNSGGSAETRGSGPLDLWEVQWPELTILRLVGHGSFGAVYLAEWKQIQVAVKVLVAKENMHRGQLELPDKVVHQLQAEAAVMSRMRHPNILQFMGLVTVPPALITEYCSRGSLYDCLAAAGQQPAAAAQLTWRRRLGMAVDAGAGLLYLHGRGIIHRDVKSPNLLVDDAWRVKVADFNLSKLLEGARPNSSLATTAANNPIWQAPEVLEGEKATAASDVYSFAMVLYELLTWRLPWTFDRMTPFKVATTIVAGGRPEVPPREALPGPDTVGWAGLDAYVQLMRDCWAPRPEDRPSFDQVVGRLRRLLADTAGG